MTPGEFSLSTTTQAALAAAYQVLAERCHRPDPSVAVRSSGADEDSGSASFAGQYETFLNVVGLKAVAQAVARCWASAYGERALVYRRQQGLSVETIRLAVLVQQLVAADVAAVVFSANPANGDQDQVVINANWGLGESIVGGTATPDSYVLRKSDLAIVSRQMGEKQFMTILAPDGVREVAVPRFLRQRLTLADVQIFMLARLAVDLEQSLGWPVDLEAAFQNGRLYVLQCRPITTLSDGSQTA